LVEAHDENSAPSTAATPVMAIGFCRSPSRVAPTGFRIPQVRIEAMEGTVPSSAKSDGTNIFLVLWRAYRTLLADAGISIKRIHLCESDFRVLEALLREGPLPVNVIGQKVDLTTGSITTAIDRLESKGLVVRKHHTTDRRLRVVELTAKGRKLIETAYAQHWVDMEKSVGNLSRKEREKLVDLLQRLASEHEETAE
jgi:MarR family 2-MHQ and catechol resistance regulon transcriptional repressor